MSRDYASQDRYRQEVEHASRRDVEAALQEALKPLVEWSKAHAKAVMDISLCTMKMHDAILASVRQQVETGRYLCCNEHLKGENTAKKEAKS